MTIQPDLGQTLSETQIVGFLVHWFTCHHFFSCVSRSRFLQLISDSQLGYQTKKNESPEKKDIPANRTWLVPHQHGPSMGLKPARSHLTQRCSDQMIKCGNEIRDLNHSTTTTNEPPHGKTNNLHRRKQRRRSASW